MMKLLATDCMPLISLIICNLYANK